MKVLAIFTCYNRRELTRQSMELLGQNKNVTFDYVIVNDGSTDGTDEMLAAMPYEIDLITATADCSGTVACMRRSSTPKRCIPITSIIC